MTGALIGAIASAAIAAVAAGEQAPSDRIVVARGHVADEDERGEWFALDQGERRFRLPPEGSSDLDAFLDLIDAAAERGAALRVRYDAAAGEAGDDLPYVIFPVCSMSIGDEAPTGDEAANCPPTSGSGTGPAARLADGVGIAWDRPEEGRALLGEALAADGLPVHLRALGHRVRGRAAEQLARRHPRASPEYDRLVAESLADYRRSAALAPDDYGAGLLVVRGLIGLGGYDQALAALADLARIVPDRGLEIATVTADVHRRLGDPGSALALLDDFAAREGPQEGMRFHYHRAWTLMMLGRDREAVEAVGRGLPFQPDYAAAWMLRSCAQARRGRLREALADQERAYALLTGPPDNGEPELAEAIARSRTLVATLRAAVTAGRRGPLPAGCESFWDLGPPPRPRSPLLDGPASRMPSR